MMRFYHSLLNPLAVSSTPWPTLSLGSRCVATLVCAAVVMCCLSPWLISKGVSYAFLDSCPGGDSGMKAEPSWLQPLVTFVAGAALSWYLSPAAMKIHADSEHSPREEASRDANGSGRPCVSRESQPKDLLSVLGPSDEQSHDQAHGNSSDLPPSPQNKPGVVAAETKPKVQRVRSKVFRGISFSGKSPGSVTIASKQEAAAKLVAHGVNRIWKTISDPTSPMDGIRLTGWLGKGAFSNVYRAQWGTRELALKVCKVTSRRRMERNLTMEAGIGISTRHPNVVTTYCYTLNLLQPAVAAANEVEDAISDTITRRRTLQGQVERLEGKVERESEEFSVEMWEIRLLQECCDLGTLRSAIRHKHLSKEQGFSNDPPVDEYMKGMTHRGNVDLPSQYNGRSHTAQGASSSPLLSMQQQPLQPGDLADRIRQPLRCQSFDEINQTPAVNQSKSMGTFGMMASSVSQASLVTEDGLRPLSPTRDGELASELQFRMDDSMPHGITKLRRRSEENPQDMAAVLSLAADIVEGMAYLHSKGVIHGDLKTANILLKTATIDGVARVIAKVADFGTSVILEGDEEVKNFFAGTPAYMAPEVLANSRVCKASDVYSFGILLFELTTGEKPYPNYSSKEIMYEVVHYKLRPQITVNLPRPLIHLMTQCWQQDATKRPSFSVIRLSLQEIRRQLVGNTFVCRSWALPCRVSSKFATDSSEHIQGPKTTEARVHQPRRSKTSLTGASNSLRSMLREELPLLHETEVPQAANAKHSDTSKRSAMYSSNTAFADDLRACSSATFYTENAFNLHSTGDTAIPGRRSSFPMQFSAKERQDHVIAHSPLKNRAMRASTGFVERGSAAGRRWQTLWHSIDRTTHTPKIRTSFKSIRRSLSKISVFSRGRGSVRSREHSIQEDLSPSPHSKYLAGWFTGRSRSPSLTSMGPHSPKRPHSESLEYMKRERATKLCTVKSEIDNQTEVTPDTTSSGTVDKRRFSAPNSTSSLMIPDRLGTVDKRRFSAPDTTASLTSPGSPCNKVTQIPMLRESTTPATTSQEELLESVTITKLQHLNCDGEPAPLPTTACRADVGITALDSVSTTNSGIIDPLKAPKRKSVDLSRSVNIINLAHVTNVPEPPERKCSNPDLTDFLKPLMSQQDKGSLARARNHQSTRNSFHEPTMQLIPKWDVSDPSAFRLQPAKSFSRRNSEDFVACATNVSQNGGPITPAQPSSEIASFEKDGGSGMVLPSKQDRQPITVEDTYDEENEEETDSETFVFKQTNTSTSNP